MIPAAGGFSCRRRVKPVRQRGVGRPAGHSPGGAWRNGQASYADPQSEWATAEPARVLSAPPSCRPCSSRQHRHQAKGCRLSHPSVTADVQAPEPPAGDPCRAASHAGRTALAPAGRSAPAPARTGAAGVALSRRWTSVEPPRDRCLTGLALPAPSLCQRPAEALVGLCRSYPHRPRWTRTVQPVPPSSRSSR